MKFNKSAPLLACVLTMLLGATTALAQAPTLTSAISRKTHGASTYDIGLPLTGATGIECRSVTNGMTLVVTFNKAVTSGTAAITAGTATVSGAPTFTGSTMLINLANVTNAQSITVTLQNIAASGGTLASAPITFRVLEGDVNGSGAVSVADVNLCKYYTGAVVNGFNFRTDVNASSSVSVSDINLVKYRVGTSVAGGPQTNTSPTISDVANLSTTPGTATAAIPFTLGDGETPAGSLAIRAESDNQTLLPNASITVGGSGSARTITLAPAAGQAGTTTCTITISDGLMTSSDSFILTVAAATGGGTGKLFVSSLRPEGAAVSSGAGSSTLQLSADETFATVRVTYSNLTTTKTGMHVHGPADATETGGIIFDLDTTPTQADGSWKWTFVQSGGVTVAQQIAAIKAGRTYVNVHSSRNPAGELRGHYLAASGSITFTAPANPPALPGGSPTQQQAVRFLAQASYGANDALIAEVMSQGFDQWINNQLNLPHTTQLDTLRGIGGILGEQLNFNHYWASWWKLANVAPDQLRQRVAFALSQILVVSENVSLLSQVPEGMAMYYDALGRGATGNFRTLLEEVTISPIMGEMLNLRGSRKADPARGTIPNENYAREVLQLFTIGLQQLHPDGTLKLSTNGQVIDTYNQDVVIGYARALTGWDYAQSGTATNPPLNYNAPMTPVPSTHETGTKLLLNGVVVPAGGTNQSDLKAALDNAFNHPNVGPFIAKQLIQKLVCSNPSPGYVYRVAQKFDNNGSGVRGDMKAVVRAILLDYEARSDTMIAQQGFGKLKEPILRTTAVMRGVHGYSTRNIWAIDKSDDELKQTPMRSPTVFNFFEPGYAHPGVLAQNGLVAPEFQITNETTTMTVANWFYWGIWGGFKYGDIKLNLSTEQGLAGNPGALVDRLNLVLCAGQLPDAAKTVIVNHISTIPVGDPLNRARVAVYLVATSSQFAAQK